MFVIAKNGHSAYRLDKVTAVKLEDNTKDFKEKHPEIPEVFTASACITIRGT